MRQTAVKQAGRVTAGIPGTVRITAIMGPGSWMVIHAAHCRHAIHGIAIWAAGRSKVLAALPAVRMLLILLMSRIMFVFPNARALHAWGHVLLQVQKC